MATLYQSVLCRAVFYQIDECLNIEEISSLIEARVVLEDWRAECDTYRPHQSLGGLTPAAYAAQFKQQPTTHKNWPHKRVPLRDLYIGSSTCMACARFLQSGARYR